MSLSPSLRDTLRSISPPALVVFLAATLGALLPLARPGAVATGIGFLAVLPLAALALAGVARAATITAAFAYVAALAWGYTSQVAPTYAYDGLTDAGPEPTAVLIVAALAALPAMWLPLAARRPSTVVLWVLYLLGYVPAVVVPLFMRGDLAAVLPFGSRDARLDGDLDLVVRLPPAPIAIRPLSLTRSRDSWSASSCCARPTSPSRSASGSPCRGWRACTTRALTSGRRRRIRRCGGYIVPWAGNAINPLLMGLGLARRRAELVPLGLVGQLLIYSVTGFKSISSRSFWCRSCIS